MIARLIFLVVVLFCTFCKIKRLTGRVPFYGKSLKEIVKKNTEANINFMILKKENFSKSSKLISYWTFKRDVGKEPKRKTQCKGCLEP